MKKEIINFVLKQLYKIVFLLERSKDGGDIQPGIYTKIKRNMTETELFELFDENIGNLAYFTFGNYKISPYYENKFLCPKVKILNVHFDETNPSGISVTFLNQENTIQTMCASRLLIIGEEIQKYN